MGSSRAEFAWCRLELLTRVALTRVANGSTFFGSLRIQVGKETSSILFGALQTDPSFPFLKVTVLTLAWALQELHVESLYIITTWQEFRRILKPSSAVAKYAIVIITLQARVSASKFILYATKPATGGKRATTDVDRRKQRTFEGHRLGLLK
mmetsp:Transcript_17417/g.48087  ORF Transcript_17417/g.48087 Transcript_17417/m.48087 type:complete len:152 (-) Transcript_17417:1311-1766(-)